MWKWIDILSDGEPNKQRLNRRLSITFIVFLFFAPGGLFAHAYWAVQSGDAANFARGGAWLVVMSLSAFGLNQKFLSIERWRYDQKIEREGDKFGDHFLASHYLEKQGRFFNGINLACAALGTFIWGYGDLWFQGFL